MKTYEDYLEQYIKLVNNLYNYDKASNMISDKNFDYDLSKNLGKKIHQIAVKMLNLDIDKFIKLLDDDNIYVRENSSEYLYPLFPKKCLKIMNEYADLIDNDVDKIKIDSKINGLKRGDAFFNELYKKLYKVEDLSSLNKER